MTLGSSRPPKPSGILNLGGGRDELGEVSGCGPITFDGGTTRHVGRSGVNFFRNSTGLRVLALGWCRKRNAQVA
jgi:hypothetical protein